MSIYPAVNTEARKVKREDGGGGAGAELSRGGILGHRCLTKKAVKNREREPLSGEKVERVIWREKEEKK